MGLVCFPLADTGVPPDSLNLSLIATLGFVSGMLGLGPLVAIWCSVLGGWKPYLIGSSSLLIAGAILALHSDNGPIWWLIALMPLVIAVPTCMAMESIKFIFGKFAKIESDSQAYEEGLQFKLSHLFIVTTVIAFLFGIGPALNEFVGGVWNPAFSNGFLKNLACIAAVLVINTLLSVFPVWPIVFGGCFGASGVLLLLLRQEGYRFVRRVGAARM